jgi:hypothetical protein
MLRHHDPKIQEHAAVAIRNLSVNPKHAASEQRGKFLGLGT